MLLVLAALLHHTEGEDQEKQELALLKLANFWLQRKNNGISDGLLLIGIDFPSVEDLHRKIMPLGLGEADLAVVQQNEYQHLGEQVEQVLSPWLCTKHPSAISFLNWKAILGGQAYPDANWWWTGVEAEPNKELSSIHEGMKKLLTTDFKSQAPTWLELLRFEYPKGFLDSAQENFDITMDALGIARLLNAYNEVSGNGYFDFSYEEATKALPMDLMRLSREAFQECKDETQEAFENEESTQEELAAACLKACLSNSCNSLTKCLQASFGSTSGLLWALYSSIWPTLTKPMDKAYEELFSGNTVDFGELMPQWQFVEEGWGSFTED